MCNGETGDLHQLQGEVQGCIASVERVEASGKHTYIVGAGLEPDHIAITIRTGPHWERGDCFGGRMRVADRVNEGALTFHDHCMFLDVASQQQRGEDNLKCTCLCWSGEVRQLLNRQ